jgi:hypothetical protein
VRQGCGYPLILFKYTTHKMSLRGLYYKINPGIKLTNNVKVDKALFAYNVVILQENEDDFQKNMYEI